MHFLPFLSLSYRTVLFLWIGIRSVPCSSYVACSSRWDSFTRSLGASDSGIGSVSILNLMLFQILDSFSLTPSDWWMSFSLLNLCYYVLLLFESFLGKSRCYWLKTVDVCYYLNIAAHLESFFFFFFSFFLLHELFQFLSRNACSLWFLFDRSTPFRIRFCILIYSFFFRNIWFSLGIFA